MSIILVQLLGRGECVIRHVESDTRINSSRAPEYGGSGRSFSSTDLLAAALGSCIATDLEPVAERNGISLDGISIEVEKTLANGPKRIAAFRVRVHVPPAIDDVSMLKLRRAADACLVQRSLHPDIAVDVTLSRASARVAELGR